MRVCFTLALVLTSLHWITVHQLYRGERFKPHVAAGNRFSISTSCYKVLHLSAMRALCAPRVPEKPNKSENQKVLRALHVSCLSCCVNSLVSLWNSLLVVQAEQCQKVEKEVLRQSVWVITHNRFSSLPAIRLCTPTNSDISWVRSKKEIWHSILWGRTLITCSKPICLAWSCQV